MAIVTNSQRKGQRRVDVNSGQLRLEEGNNRMLLSDGTDTRLLIGVDPRGQIVVALTKIGEDIFDAYNA